MAEQGQGVATSPETVTVSEGRQAAKWDLHDSLIAVGLVLVSGLAYLWTLAPGVVAGNSGEYQYTAYILGIVHSTGYPLYTLIGKLFTFLPVGSIAYRMNLLSAVSAALAVAMVYAVVRRLIGSRTPAVIAALSLAFSASFWSAALIAEAHTLNIFFVALDVYLLLAWADRQQVTPKPGIAWRELRGFALAYGLSLTHHRTTILLAPAFVIFIVLILWSPRRDLPTPAPRERSRRMSGGAFGLTVLVFLAPLVLYAYIPIRGSQLMAHSDPAVTAIYRDRVPEAILRGTVTAHYRQSWPGFVNLVTGQDYAVDVGVTSWQQLGDRLLLWVQTSVAQFSAIGLLLSLLGAIILLRRDWRRAVLFLLGYFSLVGFAVIYVGHGQIWYYFMPAYVFLAGFIGLAIDGIWVLLENRRSTGLPTCAPPPPRIRPYAMYVALCALLPITLFSNNLPLVDMKGHIIDQQRAQDALRQPLETGAVIMGPWDLVTPLRYYQYAENVRPDLIVVHADPAYSSGLRIIKQCIALKRPLYLLGLPPLDSKLMEALGSRAQLIPIPYYGTVDRPGPKAELGGKIALLGATAVPDSIRPDREIGTAVKLRLYWQSLAATKKNYRVFIHLNGPDGLTRAQVDESPGSVYYPTSQWQPDQVYRDEHWLTLNPDILPGVYQFEVGLYDPDTGERLSLSPAGSGGDTVKVGPVTIEGWSRS